MNERLYHKAWLLLSAKGDCVTSGRSQRSPLCGSYLCLLCVLGCVAAVGWISRMLVAWLDYPVD